MAKLSRSSAPSRAPAKKEGPHLCRLNSQQVATVDGVTIKLKTAGSHNQGGVVGPQVVLEVSSEPKITDQ